MPGSCRPFRKTGRGVYGCGEPKGFNPGGVGKPTCPQPLWARGGVLMGPESHPYDPKPGDLGRGRVKPPIRGVEARRGVTAQSAPLTPV